MTDRDWWDDQHELYRLRMALVRQKEWTRLGVGIGLIIGILIGAVRCLVAGL